MFKPKKPQQQLRDHVLRANLKIQLDLVISSSSQISSPVLGQPNRSISPMKSLNDLSTNRATSTLRGSGASKITKSIRPTLEDFDDYALPRPPPRVLPPLTTTHNREPSQSPVTNITKKLMLISRSTKETKDTTTTQPRDSHLTSSDGIKGLLRVNQIKSPRIRPTKLAHLKSERTPPHEPSKIVLSRRQLQYSDRENPAENSHLRTRVEVGDNSTARMENSKLLLRLNTTTSSTHILGTQRDECLPHSTTQHNVVHLLGNPRARELAYKATNKRLQTDHYVINGYLYTLQPPPPTLTSSVALR